MGNGMVKEEGKELGKGVWPFCLIGAGDGGGRMAQNEKM